jgi:hypothetical protein
MTLAREVGLQADDRGVVRFLAFEGKRGWPSDDERLNEMDKLREVIRPMDVVLAVLLSGLGVWLMLENINGSGDVRVDSTSWLLIPVFLVATVPILFRRANMIAVILVAAAAMAVHVAAFGWLVRCGAGLPLAIVLAYSAGKLLSDRTQSVVAMVLTIGVQYLVLVKDSAAGLDVLPFTALIGAAAWGIGLYVRSRTVTQSGDVQVAVAAGSR